MLLKEDKMLSRHTIHKLTTYGKTTADMILPF